MRAHLFTARTMYQADTGYSIIKITKFNQKLEHLQLLIARLQKFECIRYKYLHVSVENDELTIERERIEGQAVDMFFEYTPKMERALSSLITSYRLACDTFDEQGFGFLTTDYKELSNVMVDQDGVMQLIDFEDSFVVTQNRALFNQYWDVAQQHSDLEMQRFVLLSKL